MQQTFDILHLLKATKKFAFLLVWLSSRKKLDFVACEQLRVYK